MTTKQYLVKIGTSRARDTNGYILMMMRELHTGKRVGRECGGGYDMWNSLLADFICRTYQDEVRRFFTGIELGPKTEERLNYSIYRTPDGTIRADGGGGPGVTKRLCEAAGITQHDVRINKSTYLVSFTAQEISPSAGCATEASTQA